MSGFTDTKGRAWVLDINVTTLRRVKSLYDADLLEFNSPVYQRLSLDPFLLCDVLFVLCESQAKSLDVSSEDFGRALGGDVLDEAAVSLMESVIPFCPRSQRRLMEKALAKSRELEQQVTDHLEATIDSESFNEAIKRRLVEMDSEIESQLATFGTSSGNVPESSG